MMPDRIPITRQPTTAQSAIYERMAAQGKERVMSSSERKRVVIIGSSFAGLTAAFELKKKVGDRHEIVVLDPRPEPFEPERPQEDPQLQGPEAPAELGLVFAVVAHRGLAIERSEVLGLEAERRPELVHPAAQQERRIERREQPLVGIDHDGVGQLPAPERGAMIGNQGDRAGVGGINVEPQPLGRGNRGDRRHWIDRRR